MLASMLGVVFAAARGGDCSSYMQTVLVAVTPLGEPAPGMHDAASLMQAAFLRAAICQCMHA